MDYAIGIDLGATRLKALALAPDGTRLASRHGETGNGRDRIVRTVRDAVAALEAEQGRPAAWIGVASPGLASRDGRSVARLPVRLPGMEGVDWSTLLGRQDVVPVLNDAHAALVGEAWIGAAAGARDVLLLTLGTGVGGAIMSGGRLLTGHVNRAGHVGHMSLDPRGPRSIVGMPGALELAIGNCTVAERSRNRFADTASLVAAHRAGDAEATAIWLASIEALACGIASLVNIVDPEVVVIGGGIAAAGDALFEPLRAALDKVEWRPFGTGVRLIPALLGDEAGAIGAARHAMEQGATRPAMDAR